MSALRAEEVMGHDQLDERPDKGERVDHAHRESVAVQWGLESRPLDTIRNAAGSWIHSSTAAQARGLHGCVQEFN